MVLHLAERLDVPLRERNSLLLAAGFAPLYGERSLDSEEMTVVTRALDRFLRAHEPYPAVVVDRHWTLVSANDALGLMLEGVAGHLLEPLYHELAGYPGVSSESPHEEYSASAIVLPLRLRHGDGELAFFGTVTTFGTPLDVTLSEIAVEAFYPANAATANALLGEVGAG
jgi:hypothetical protein